MRDCAKPDLRALSPGRIDWAAVLDTRGRWSALVTVGSSPERAARHASGIAYLAAPYHEAAQLRGAWRIERSVRASTLASYERLRLADCGVTALCPAVDMAEMAHARVLFPDGPDPLDRRFWSAWATPVLSAARLVVVPEIEGWECCPMVWSDVVFALVHQVPVHVYAGAA